MNTSNFVSIPASLFDDQEILVFGETRLTYGQLWSGIQRLANTLRELGAGRGDCVAVLETNSHLYVQAYYAVALLGGVFLPLNYRAKLPELEYMIDAANTRLLLVGERYAGIAAQAVQNTPTVRVVATLGEGHESWPCLTALLDRADPEHEPGESDDDDVSLLMYTSGTTARPKAVLLTHNHFSSYVCNNVELADGSDRGTALLCVPLYHIAGATNVMTSMFAGRRLVLLPQFHPEEWLATVERERVTHAFLVPTMVKQLLDHPELTRYDLSSLQNVSYGGAAMPFPVIRRAIERFPSSVGWVNAFGQTETTSTLTVLGPDDHRLEGSPEEIERRLKRLRSIGRPLPDVELKVVDDDGSELPPGEVGELWVRTDRALKGYGTEAGTVSPLRDGWLPTRDMGWIDEDGYVFLAGRKDDMIIRGGENIAPAEIEAVLYSHPDIEEAAILGVASEEWGQRVAAAIVPRPGSELSPERVVAFCKERLASFKAPEIVRLFDDLPKNALGKVLRNELRSRLETP